MTPSAPLFQPSRSRASWARLSRIVLPCLLAPSAGWAGTPSSGELTPATPMQTLSYTVGPFTVSSPVATATDGPVCNVAAPCDSYKLTVTLPAGTPFTRARISIDWPQGSVSDYDLYIYSGDRGNLDGMEAPDVGSAAGSSNPEVTTIGLLPGATTVYTLKVVPFAVVPAEAVTGTITLLAEPGGGGGGGEAQSCVVPAGVRP